MKVRRLSLPAYGSFSGAETEFDLSRSIHVVYGPNEVGKTTRRSALCDLLFGFPKTTPYAFKHDMSQLRVRALLEIDGVTREIQRRKGNKDTLRDGSGELLAESTMVAWLGGTSRLVFESRFSIGRAELEGGAALLADSEGDAATSIYGAALAGVDPKAVIRELEEDANRIFLPRGKNQTLNVAINEFIETKKLVSAAVTRPDEWDALSRDRDKNAAALESLRERIVSLQGDSERLKSLCKALDDYDSLTAIRDELLHKRSVGVVVDPLTLRTLTDVRTEMARVDVLLQEYRNELNGNLTHQEAEVPRPELLRGKVEINEVREGLSAVTKAQADISRLKLEEQERTYREDFERRCSFVWPGITEGQALERRPSVADILLVQNLAAERQSVQLELETARALAGQARSKLLACSEEAEQLGVARDAEELEAVLDAARSSGDLEKKLVDLRRSKIVLATSCTRDLETLPLFSGGLEDLAALRLPLPETMAAFNVELGDLKSRVSRHEEHANKARSYLKALEVEVSGHDSRHVGTAEALAEARLQRNGLFFSLLESWRAEEPASEQILAYNTSVEATDRMADQRFETANAISRADAAYERLKHAHEDVTTIEKDAACAAQDLADGIRRWQEQWTDVVSEPRSPGEMTEWHRRVTGVRAAVFEVARIQTDITDVELEQARQIAELRSALSRVGKQTESSDRTVLIRLAADNARAIGEAAARIRQIARERKRDEATVEKYEADAGHHGAKLVECQLRWLDAAGSLHLHADLASKDVNEVTNEIRTMFEALDAAEGFRKRIRGIERDRQDYCGRARSLIATVAADLLPAFDSSFAEGIKEWKRRRKFEPVAAAGN